MIDDAFTGQIKCTVIATGFTDEKPSPAAAMMSPAQRHLQSAMSRSPMRISGESQKRSLEPGLKSTAPDLSEEELEIPAFMRKPLSK